MLLSFCSFLFLSFIFTFSCGQVVPDCPDRGETICLGHSASRESQSSGNSVSEILQHAREQFCGCRYIRDNVVISTGSNLPDANEPLVEANFSFLYHVREISGYLELNSIPPIARLSLPNLRLIRGENIRSNRYSLAVIGKINNLYMPNLTEITRGDVLIRGSSSEPYLCNTKSINWNDTAPDPINAHRFLTSGCTESDIINCTALGCSSGFCWCNDTVSSCCQTLSFNCNCNNRCFRGDVVQCCSTECAAGCTGGNPDQCRACKNVLNDGTCTASCPPRRIISNDVVIDNPNFRLEAKPLCVMTCPNMLFELETNCIDDCPAEYMSVNDNGTMRCVQCDGPCEQECAGGIFDYTRPGAFAGCTIITGSLRISSVPVNTDFSILNDLNDIKDIRGSLDISGFNKETFPYLSNLRIIGNDSSQVLSQSCNGSSDRFRYSIIISDTDLVSIDLSSLETVRNGGIRLQSNPSLCYLGNLSYYIANTSSPSCILDNYRRDIEECVELNLTCHSQCLPESGWCWGANDTQCVTCRNFIYDGQCVPFCNDFETHGVHLFGHTVNNTCLPCHSFCNGSCAGEGPSNCSDCATNFFLRVETGVGILCLEECLTDTYSPDNRTAGECLRCFEGCSLGYGCAGPGNTFNKTNGCRRCDTVVLDKYGKQVECQRDQVNCPSGHYREQLESDRDIFLTGTVLCYSCHELCETCNGPFVNSCLTCSFIRGSNGSCVYECDPIREVTPNNGSLQCIPTTTINPSSSSGLSSGAVIGLVMGIVVLVVIVGLIFVFVIIFVPRALKKKSNYNLNEVFSSPEELELFTLGKETLQPPRMAPNATRLIVAPEDELKFGKELGAGAFGTVYEGYWKPTNDENEYHVAIKVLKNTSASASKELLQEGVVMATMDHENVVRLYCVCMSKQLMLVSQFVPLGALLDYLKKQQDRLNAHTILLFASQIARGMAYLETKRLVHRDLAARNVLIQTPVKVKITDFGLTRIIEANQSHYEATTSKMPVRWLPPESIRHRVFTHKTDVWSFGVTVWEILTFGARPYQGKKPYEILKMLEGGHRLDQPLTCTIDLYAVLLECWLLEPESRPDFEELGHRFQEFMDDPPRYVLTVLDGNTADYLMLPSNVHQAGDEAYEQPVTNETCPSNVSITGTLPSNDNAVNPYAMAFSAEAYEISPPDTTPVVIPTKKLSQDYEVPVEGSSSASKGPRSPRYVDMVVPAPKKHSYDYIDEKKLLANENPADEYTLMSDIPTTNEPTSPYEVPNDGKTQPRSAADITENYEFADDPNRLGSPLSPDDKTPLISGGMTNLLYDSNPNNDVPQIHDYEDVNDDNNQPQDGGFTNLMYDSRVGSETGPFVSAQNGVSNLTYDSRAGTAGKAVPDTHNYEDIEDEATPQGGLTNLMYDSRAGTAGKAVPDTHNYEDIEDEATPQGGLTNLMYDSRAGTVGKTSVPDTHNYEDIEDEATPQGGLTNLMYDSRAGTVGKTSVPDTHNYEDIEDDDNLPTGGFSNVMYDSKAGTLHADVPQSHNYEDIEDDISPPPQQQQSFSNMMYDSRAGVSSARPEVPDTNNYEEVDELPPEQKHESFSNMTYDSRAGLTANGHSSSNERALSPYEVPIKENGFTERVGSPYEVPISSDERTVSPYEVPVKDGDYELPTDGMPRVPQYNVYEAPAN